MIVKNLIAWILGVSLIKTVLGSSLSNVFVESEISPSRYYQYSAPYSYPPGPLYSRINTLRISDPTYVNPCVLPCVIPGQAFTPLSPSTNVVTYNSPSATVPVVVEPNEKTKGYQYSYSVYENNGDHNTQNGLSDGSVVLEEYKLIPPVQYVQETQNVADDIKGYNLVVKKLLPITVEDNGKSFPEDAREDSPPCHTTKKESLSKTAATVQVIKVKPAVNYNEDNSHKSEQADIPEYSGQNLQEQRYNYNSGEKGQEFISHDEIHEHKSNEERSHELQGINYFENYPKEEYENSLNIIQESGKGLEQEFESSREVISKKYAGETQAKSKEKIDNKYDLKRKDGFTGSQQKNKKSDSGEKTIIHLKHKEAHEFMLPEQKVLIPYHEVVRCVQAALKKSYEMSTEQKQDFSPLSYIVLNTAC